MILLNKKVFLGLCGINIFFNIVLLASFFFPDFIFPIDYNNPVVMNVLLPMDSLKMNQDFYFLSEYYQEFYEQINTILFYLYPLISAATIIGSTRAPKAYFFITLALLFNIFAPLVYPQGVERWEVGFMFSASITLTAIIWGIKSVLRAQKDSVNT